MICKHAHTQFLCDSIEAARPHIPYKIETHIAQVFPDIPVLLVHRVDDVRVVSNYPSTKVRELIATISVTDENKLNIWNNSREPDGNDFHALVQPLINPENYLASAL